MSTTANDISSRSAQEVGWIFVREYCYHLQEKPETLFQFYDKQSSLIRGLEGEEVKICQGQQEIKKNITEMQLKDALIKIINVDSLEFLDGKVVIQVIGEISNKGEAYKKFVRTVILVKQTDDNDNYYVLSDIFRYLKDENANVTKHQTIDQEPSYIEDGLSTLNEEKSANGEDTVSSTGTLNEESAQEPNRELKGIEDNVPDIPPTKTETPSLAKSSTEDSINQVDENSTESEKSNLSDVRSKVQPSPINVQTEKLATTSSNATNQITSPTESRSPSKPSTWANLAASDQQKWGNSQLAESKGRVVQPPLTRTQSQQSNREQHRDQRDREQRDQNTRGSGSTVNNKEFSLYVKGIVEGMTRPTLEKAFSKFGLVKNVDVVLSKSCAFVEFGSQEAYQQTLSQKEIDVPGYNMPVVVEERKPKGYFEQGRRYDNHHRSYNGINSQRANRGGRNTAARPPGKS
ncbi:hypothetical protein RclHR1_08450010 [Rhizophagus clarus]|uniref:NTF2 domain-containing protein n=1 Tax=Rhizophagus clarus TaxID=94130 RepID=A0A2Z6SG01_9GLOM|nr:hypothetical protein RclHR1_08450010 [Rhizophagus clarus]